LNRAATAVIEKKCYRAGRLRRKAKVKSKKAKERQGIG
jgi:hypothetical protein